MNRLAFVLGVILVGVILCLPSNGIAQDPNDPGEPDTVYFAPGGMRSVTGDTLYVWPDSFPQDVIIYVNAWNDNDVVAFYVVLIDSCNGPPCNADLDTLKNNHLNECPKCLEGSRAEYFDTKICKVKNFPPQFYVTALIMYEDPMPPGDGLLATFVFTVHDTGRICLDTTFVPPALVTVFVTTEAQGYTPIFKQKDFVIANCAYSCGDPNYDGITNVSDVVYLINYVLRSGPQPCVEKSGNVNCDDIVDILDITYFIDYLFRNGPAPQYCP